MTDADERPWKIACLASLVFAVALCAAPLHGHSDEVDPHTYAVLARHMAESGRWLDPSYLPSIFYRYREHLPFGLWPSALAVRLFGERALAPLALMFSLGTLTIMITAGARLFGRTAALLGVLVLTTTDAFFQSAGRMRLDNLLLLLATASTLPLWRPDRIAPAQWAISAALSSLAVLVKGPFGLLPLVASTLARAVTLRRAREILVGGLAAIAALVPVIVFLAHDALLGDGSWWRGYVLHQIYASARGLRSDGDPGLVPLTSLVGRFWPGLPLSVWGIALGLRDLRHRRATAVAIAAAYSSIVFTLLWLPARKLPHHGFVMYPALALLAGAAVAPVLTRRIASSSRRSAAVAALVGLAAATTVVSALGAGTFLTRRSCVIPPQLGSALPPGADVLVVAPGEDWTAIAALAAHYRANAWPARSLEGDVPFEVSAAGSRPVNSGRRARFALVRTDAPAGPHAGWRQGAEDGKWTLWTRDSAPNNQ